MERKPCFQFKEKSKRIACAIALISISIIIRIIFSNIGLFATTYKSFHSYVAVLEILLVAVLIAVRAQKIPSISFGVMVTIWSVSYMWIDNYSTSGVLFFATGIILMLMAYGVITIKFFSFFIGSLTIAMIIQNFINRFRLFFFINYFHDGIVPTDLETMNFALFEIHYFCCLLFAIGIMLCVGALCLKEIPIAKKRNTENISNVIHPTPTINSQMDSGKKFCSHCGKEIIIQAVVCPHCGCSVAPSAEEDIPSKGLNILSFFIPLVGLILYCLSHDKTPNKAKEIGKWAIIGFAVGVGCSVLLLIFYLILLNL